MLQKQFIQDYFNADFRNVSSLLTDILVPIFGDYDRGYDEITQTETAQKMAYAANIKTIKHVATLPAMGLDIKVFDVTLENNCHIHHARKGIQTLIRQYVDKFEGAFIIFHYEDPINRSWRFSYLEKRENAKSSTDAKRYTYLCGKQYPCRTLAERFEKLQSQDLTAVNLEAAFSVEALSDEFFDEYRNFYQDLVNFVKNENDLLDGFIEYADGDKNLAEKYARDYIKKLMGRLVFIQFLQNKAWLKDDIHYTHTLFDSCNEAQKDNFLDNVLEPLFFGVFNTPKPERETLFRQEHWDMNLFAEWKDFPYLNGGLFECDELDKLDLPLPDYFFSNPERKDRVRKPDDEYYNDACGIFDFFDRYNFTIDESDPLDREVGVDPEMLGKIFENLLEDNKDKGAFYTPKEIVQYMCKEALVAYLVDEARRKSEVNKQRQENFEEAIRRFVSDPEKSIGNMRQYASSNKQQIIDLNESLCSVKICDPAIGSGAFPMGLLNLLMNCRVALNRALGKNEPRAWLKKEIIQNNIYGVDIEKGAIDIARLRFWLSIVVDLDEPEALPNFDYKFMQGNSLLEQYNGIDLSMLAKSKSSLHEVVQITMFEDQLDILKRELRQHLNDYFLTTNHQTKARLRQEINENVNQQLLEQHVRTNFPEQFDISANDQFFLWRTWFADVFNRPNKEGFDIVIGNPPYGAKLSSDDKAKYRKVYPESQFKIDTYSLFVLLALNLASQSGICYYIIPNTLLDNYFEEEVRKKLLKRSIIEINDLSDKVFSTAVVHSMIFGYTNKENDNNNVKVNTSSELQQANIVIPQCFFGDQPQSAFSIRSYGTNDLSSKLKKSSVKLVDVLDIRQAIKTGDDSYYITSEKLAENFKPILRGKDVNKYSIRDPHLFVNYGKHLACPRNHEIFEQSKILIREAGATITATLDEDNYYIMSSLYNAILIDKSYNMRFLLGLINSKLFQYLMYKLTFEKTKGAFTKAKIFHYYELPVKITSHVQQQPIIDLVDAILAAKRQNPQADTSAQEAQIDQLVYALYNLTDEEIKLIENN